MLLFSPGFVTIAMFSVNCARSTENVPSDMTQAAGIIDAGSSERMAQFAAEAWLSLVDAGNYAKSWTEAADAFKKRIDQAGWQKALDGVRTPLGNMLGRVLVSAQYATALPGAPDGEYVVLTFDTSFEKKRGSVETVTPMKQADGRWRVSGYFIK